MGVVGWLPLVGLVSLVIGGTREGPLSSVGLYRILVDQARRFSDPPVPGILVNSLILGFEVAGATIVLTWLVGRGSRARPSHGLGALLARRIAFVPPLVQGVGFLALPWLAGLASALLVDLGRWRPLAPRTRSYLRRAGPFAQSMDYDVFLCRLVARTAISEFLATRGPA